MRHWLPELARMPTEWIHHPWDAPRSVLRASGVELGLNYPKPIVDINLARERLLDSISVMWESDTAARAAKLNGTEEDVADNSNSMENQAIPRVVIKKDISCASSAHDQRVPTLQKPKDGFYDQKGLKASVLERKNCVDLLGQVSKAGASQKDEDLCSTAESSSVRKRSISESQCVIPPSFSSSSNGKYAVPLLASPSNGNQDNKGDCSNLDVQIESSSKRPWKEQSTQKGFK